MPERALRHFGKGKTGQAYLALAARTAAEKREEGSGGGGDVMRARRYRVAAMIAFGVGLRGLVAAMRAFDVVVIVAHVFGFLCVGARAGRDHERNRESNRMGKISRSLTSVRF